MLTLYFSINSIKTYTLTNVNSEITVDQLKQKLEKIESLKPLRKALILNYQGIYLLDDKRKLNSYQIKNKSLISGEKYLQLFHNKLLRIDTTHRRDEIAGNSIDVEGVFRTILTCGHAADPNSLTDWIKTLLDDGETSLYCPALCIGGKRCNKVWKYELVKKRALLTLDESEYFDKRLNENIAMNSESIKKCPKCESYTERSEDLSSSLKMLCIACKCLHKVNFYFCWQCENEWTPLQNKKDTGVTCGRDNCKSKDLLILENCKLIRLQSCKRIQEMVPSIRACPSCGKLHEHEGSCCKNIVCIKCKVEFCFLCLEKKQTCSKTSGPYEPCSVPIAPIQIKINKI